MSNTTATTTPDATSVSPLLTALVCLLVALAFLGAGIAVWMKGRFYIRSRGLGVIVSSALLASTILLLVTTPVASVIGDFVGANFNTTQWETCLAWLTADITLSVAFASVSFSRLFEVFYRIGLQKTMRDTSSGESREVVLSAKGGTSTNPRDR